MKYKVKITEVPREYIIEALNEDEAEYKAKLKHSGCRKDEISNIEVMAFNKGKWTRSYAKKRSI